MLRPIVGMTLAFLWEIPLPLTLAFLLGLLALGYAVHHWHPEVAARWRVAALLAAMFALGFLRYEGSELGVLQKDHSALEFSRLSGARVTGTVAGALDTTITPARFVIENLQVHAEGQDYNLSMRALVTCGFMPEPALRIGDRIRLSSRLEPVHALLWPGQFDYAEYLASRNIHAQIRVWNAGQLEHLGRVESWPLSARRFLADIRSRIFSGFKQSMNAGDAALLGAMVLGERASLPQETEDLLIETGVFHITTVSGLHITAIAVFLILAGKLAGLKRRRAALAAVPLLLLFQCLVGWNHAALRSTFLGVALMAGRWIKRDTDTLASLAASALLLVMISPLALFQIGFQLSYLFTLGIVLGGRRLQGTALMERLGKARQPFHALAFGFFISAAAFLFGAPALAYHFQTFTPISILVNPIACGLVNLVMIGGLLQSILIFIFVPLADLLGQANVFFLHALLQVVGYFHSVPFGHMQVPYPGLLLTLCAYAFLLLLFADPRILQLSIRGHVIKKYQLLLATFAAAVLLSFFPAGRGLLRVDFLSVGQGDAALLRFPKGGTMLIDGGPPQISPAVPWEKTRFARYFQREGIQQIDVLVTTHPQMDHIGAAIEVLEHFPVVQIFDSGVRLETETSGRYEAAIKQSGAARHFIHQGMRIEGFEGVSLEILNPPVIMPSVVLSGNSEETNDTSAVLLLQHGNVDFLFTGDIGDKTERELASLADHIDVEILKVPHHGSPYSTREPFLAVTTPDVAVIEVGRNSYGHPAPETLERLGRYAALIYRTDYDGTVRVTSDGKSYRVEALKRREGE